ncbi:peptidoglycan recognition protein family protein [Shinella zoogloeoides]|uniref:peptidoglycan recognition protein family protein n=1 Tax=Shinella zoogloeoides TaxID=352475 RepID=UPI00273D03C3|nr:peptidoglycan-binding protein [Shinella zoogloeoides]WLR94256.1 N-acetylmuramoyl-L-alanine amidase [Shinella zoogloeoides]
MTTILVIQERLIALGYKPGTADGIDGPKTREAVKAFQRDKGVTADGKVGPVTHTLLFETETRSAAASTSAAAVIEKQAKATRKIVEIIVHCTATPERRDYSLETIRKWHLERGWNDIGYHYVVHPDGVIEAGRPEAKVGSHVAGHNSGTLGIVYVGGVAADGKTPKDTRTAAQKAALLDLAKALIAKYPAIKKVTGHNQYAAKACPSFDVRRDPLGALV